jgi:hypothetical protein
MATRVKASPGKPESGGISFLISDEEYASAAASQRRFFHDIADRVARGEALEERMHRELAAGALRAFADQIPLKQPRKRGQKPRIDAGNVAIHYACLVNGQGMKKSQALADLAEGNGVSIEAIRNAVAKFGEAALRLVPKNPNLKKK